MPFILVRWLDPRPVGEAESKRVELRPRLHSVVVFAPDLDAGKAFYREVLGFAVEAESDAHVSMRGDGFALTLFKCDSAGSAEGYARRAGSSIAFAVPSIDESVEALRGRGVELLHDEPASGPSGRYVAFLDPFGTVHELVEQAVVGCRG